MVKARINRREFLKIGTTGATALTIGFALQIKPKPVAAEYSSNANAWIKIDNKNKITLVCDRAEMGQDVYTSLAMLIAEELEVKIQKVAVEFAPPGERYINAFFGAQLTGGSTSVRDAWEKLRKAGATARTMFINAAADKWEVSPASCHAKDGHVISENGKKASYGSLVKSAVTIEMPKEVQLKSKKDWRLIGKTNVARLDTPAKVDGTAQFGIDTKVPGMLYAAVKMVPTIGGKIIEFDDTRARNSAGVKHIVKIDAGISVIADSYWNAKKGRDLLSVKYDHGPNRKLDSAQIWSEMEQASDKPGATFRSSGDLAIGMEKAQRKVSAEYRLPFLSHSPMEPMNAMADIGEDQATVITGAQFPQIIPSVVSEQTGIPPENVKVVTTFLGGSFGRRGGMDYVIAAIQSSKSAKAPVNLIWDREDDLTNDNYRPAGIFQLTAGLDGKGKVSAMKFHSTSPSISAVQWPSIVKDGIDPFAVEGIDNYPYATKDLNFTYQIHSTPIEPGFWRSVSHTVNAVALECFIDECAAAADQDPIDYRISQLDMGSTKHQWSGLSAGIPVGSRMKNVLEKVRSKSNWGKALGLNRGAGVAVMEGYNTVIAMVAEVLVDDQFQVYLEKVTAVVDAGTIVHPDQALAQIQGSINDGHSAALWSEITLKNGQIEQNNFDSYRIARINESPKTLDITFVESDGSFVGGLGEPGTAVIQPAIGNAIFAATGKRCRNLPFTPENINAS